MNRPSAITREEIAEIHEAIATRRPAQTEAEQKDQHWHAYAAKILRENHADSPFAFHPSVGERPFTHAKYWLS